MATNYNNILEQGEKVLWDGKSSQGTYLSRAAKAKMALAMILLAVSALWEAKTITANVQLPLVFHFVGVVFIIAAAYVIVGIYFIEVMLPHNTSYCITNTRIVIDYKIHKSIGKLILGQTTLGIQSISLNKVRDIKIIHDFGNEIGTIDLGLDPIFESKMVNRFGGPALVVYPRLVAIRDVYKIRDILIEAKQGIQNSKEPK